MDCIDLGCGSGQLTLRLAPKVHSIRAIDVSQAMIDLLLQNARAAGVTNVTGEAVPIERLVVDNGVGRPRGDELRARTTCATPTRRSSSAGPTNGSDQAVGSSSAT